MSQEEFGDESTYINSSFDHEEKQQNFEGITTMINLEKLTQSKTISAEDLHSQMARKVKRITEVVPGITTTKARSLLMKNRWDDNRALDSAFDSDLSDDENHNSSRSSTSSSSSSPATTCAICLEEVFVNMDYVTCQHKFCDECLSKHISLFIAESIGLPRNAVTCPGYQCKSEINDDVVMRLLADKPDLKMNYSRMISNAFVSANVYLQWCPRSGCTNAVKINEGVMQSRSSVRCSCRHWFCFQCQDQCHEPLECERYQLWMNVTSEEAQSQNWILKNSKKCPNTTCRVDIQKNGGCTHMTCRNCKHEFCWICMGPWSAGRHICDAQAVKTTNGAGDGEKTYTSRLQHFNGYYQKMLESLKDDEKWFKIELKPLIADEVELPNCYLKTDFLDNTLEILKLCRRTLMFSYAFNYYMTTIDNEIFVFEQKLTNLEQCTEKLAEKLRKVDMDNLVEMKVELTDAALVSLKCRRYILENIQEGRDKGWWKTFPIPLNDMLAPPAAMEENEDFDFEYNPLDFV